jgi:hypothetical protein
MVTYGLSALGILVELVVASAGDIGFMKLFLVIWTPGGLNISCKNSVASVLSGALFIKVTP